MEGSAATVENKIWDKKRIEIGILGLGVVGSGAVALLESNRAEIEQKIGLPFVIKRIAVRNIDKPRAVTVDRALLTTNASDILDDPDIDIVCELIGGIDPAHSYVLRALKAGARAYLLKDSAEADLGRAILAVKEGKSFFSPAVSKVLLEDYMRKLARSGAEDSFDLLSAREREILQLVAEGNSSKEVANLLNLSVHTVETHRSNLMQKLNLRGLPELILYAVRKGLIS